MSPTPVWIALPLLVLLPEPVRAQEPDTPAEEEEIVRLTAWPELTKDQKKSLKTEISRLRKARTETMGEEAHAALVAMGAAIVPELLPTLGKEKKEDAIERIGAVLTAVTGPEHTRLLAKEFGAKSVAVRTWALRRAAGFPEPGFRAEAETALAAVEKLAEKDKADKNEYLAAALAATAGGSLEGLDYLHRRARKGWGKHGKAMRVALEAVRGPEATKIIAAKLKDAERVDTIAALNLLAGGGDRETAVRHVRPHLDNTDNSIRIAAINALRGIVDGDPPIDKLPVFEAIERANKWKTRV